MVTFQTNAINSVEQPPAEPWQIVTFYPPRGLERPIGVSILQSSSLDLYFKTTEELSPGTLFVMTPSPGALEGLYRIVGSRFLSGSSLWFSSAVLVTLQPTPACLQQARGCCAP